MNTRVVSFTSNNLKGFEDPYVYLGQGKEIEEKLDRSTRQGFGWKPNYENPEDPFYPNKFGDSYRRPGILKKSDDDYRIHDVREFMNQIRSTNLDDLMNSVVIPNYPWPIKNHPLSNSHAPISTGDNNTSSLRIRNPLSRRNKNKDAKSVFFDSLSPTASRFPQDQILTESVLVSPQAANLNQVGRPRQSIFSENGANVLGGNKNMEEHIFYDPLNVKQLLNSSVNYTSTLNNKSMSIQDPPKQASLGRPGRKNEAPKFINNIQSMVVPEISGDVEVSQNQSRNEPQEENTQMAPLFEVTMIMRLGEGLGYEFMFVNSTIYCYDFVHQIYYKNDMTRLPLAKHFGHLRLFSGVHVGHCVVMVTGGANSARGEISNEAYLYDYMNNSSFPVANMFSRRMKHCLVFVEEDEAVYALGGLDTSKTKLRSVERFSMRSRTWTKLAPMKYERSDFKAIYSSTARCLYVVGGCDKLAGSMQIEKYDTTMDVWTILPFEVDSKLVEGNFTLATPSRVPFTSPNPKIGLNSSNPFMGFIAIFGREPSANKLLNLITNSVVDFEIPVTCTEPWDRILIHGDYFIRIQTALGIVEVYHHASRQMEATRFVNN